MKEKKSAIIPAVDTTPVFTPPPVINDTFQNEKLSDGDKSALDLAKAKRELALANAKTALAQSENAELSYNNVILQLALRYKLVDGDEIAESGEIKRIVKAS